VKKTLLDFFDEIHDFTEQVEKGDGVVISLPNFQWIHPETDRLPVKGRKREALVQKFFEMGEPSSFHIRFRGGHRAVC